MLPLQDDAHIFCLPNQIGPEIGRVLDLTEDIMTAFGFEADGFEVGAGIVTLNRSAATANRCAQLLSCNLSSVRPCTLCVQWQINLSTRPEKSVGSDDIWHMAEDALRAAIEAKVPCGARLSSSTTETPRHYSTWSALDRMLPAAWLQPPGLHICHL